jgi:hypothetical protein
MRNPKWITLAKAREITGHETQKAWERWLQRWNTENPTLLVRVRPRYVEHGSLLAALEAQSDRHTPGLAAAKALVEMDRKSRQQPAGRRAC